MKQLIDLLLIGFSLNLNGQTATLLGKKVPELNFEYIINYQKQSAKLSDFGNKVVVLDFWATWCLPCIKSFPHLEKLQNKYSKDLQIITITDDAEERIKSFQKKQSLQLPVVIDKERELSSLFPHRSLPHTIVIDKAGIVQAITTSAEITEDVITKVISNQHVEIKEKKDILDFDPSKPLSGNENVEYQVTITPFREGLPSLSNSGGDGEYKNRRIVVLNQTPKAIYETAFRFPVNTRTVIEVADKSKFNWNKNNTFCFDLIVPQQLGERRFEIMKKQLEMFFDYRAFLEERVHPVKVLRKIDGAQIKIEESDKNTTSTSSSSGNGLSLKNSSIDRLTRFLEARLQRPVVDGTELKGKYNLDIPWYHENPDQIHVELKKIGLELVDEKKKITVLVIRDGDKLWKGN